MRARIRTVKPEIMSDEEFWDLEVAANGGEPVAPLYRAFQGLWMLADREGRFEWRPRMLGRTILPYWKGDFGKLLDELLKGRCIFRYEVDGKLYGLVRTLKKNQRFNNREPESELPAPPENLMVAGSASADFSMLEHDEGKEKQDSSTTSAEHNTAQVPLERKGNGKGKGRGSGRGSGSGRERIKDPDRGGVEDDHTRHGNPSDGNPTDTHTAPANGKSTGARCFDAYAEEYRQRYGVVPLADAKARSQWAQFGKRAGAEDGPPLAAFYVSLNHAEYVAAAHPIGYLLRDVDVVRVQWKTGHRITRTAARRQEARDDLGDQYRNALDELDYEDTHG